MTEPGRHRKPVTAGVHFIPDGEAALHEHAMTCRCQPTWTMAGWVKSVHHQPLRDDRGRTNASRRRPGQ